MRWLRSLAEPADLGGLVRDAYGLEVTGCTLVRSLANDVYEVGTPTARFALKVYRHGGRSTGEAAWEQELLLHASAQGVAVAVPVRLAGGGLAGEAEYPEGGRAYALTEWVEGSKPRPPFTDELYRAFGAAIARFHQAGDTFASTRLRRPFDLDRDLFDPLPGLLDALSHQGEDQRLVGALAHAAGRHLAEAGGRGADWGVCHGDVSMDNVHLGARALSGAGLVLHDLDLARQGWRAGDLVGVSGTPHWEAFRGGYTDVRPLSGTDLALVPWLRVVDLIANLRFHLLVKPQTRGSESVSEGWAERELTSLRTLAAELLQSL